MNPHVRDWVDKALVQAAAAAAVLLAWFALWGLVRPWDPEGALVFVPGGGFGRLVVFMAMVWALAAACALATLPSRPEGSLLAALVGAAALGLRGGGMDELLMYSADLRGTFLALTGEMLLMGVVVVGAAMVVSLVRGLMRRLAPRLVWREPPPVAGTAPAGPVRTDRKPAAPTSWMLTAGKCLVVELAVATVLLVVTFRSIEPGQIAFALTASFAVGAFAAHSFFPIRSSIPFWLAPLLMGTLVLVMGGKVVAGAGPDWHQAVMVARDLPVRAALPVHWLGFGCGGAVLGYWSSRRLSQEEKADAKAPARA